jgi:hypothetical protein
MADAVRFIKVSKKDKNGVDKTLTLQSLSELTIPYSTGNVKYKILNITEKPTYFLYEVNNPNLEWADRTDVEYILTGSIEGSYTDTTPGTYNKSSPSFLNPTSDPLNFVIPINPMGWDEDGDGYSLNTYPQKDIYIYATGSVHFEVESGTGGAITPRVRLLKIKKNNEIITLDTDILLPSILHTDTTLTRSFEISYNIPPGSLPGEIYYIGFIRQFTSTDIVLSSSFSDTSFLYITSSVSSGLALNTIPEPYFSENFSRALDCQPLLNNAINNRLSSFHQDIDYSSGLLTPTNFELLISGSALKASIQDSNYTLKRHTNPRYEGSRTTSQKLNEWTEGDTNTFGKSPTTLTQDRVIYEFEFGGGTTPEILGWGGLKMSNLYLVNTTSSIRTIQSGIDSTTRVVRSNFPEDLPPGIYRRTDYISQSFDEYYYTLNKNNPINHEITLFQYDPNPSNTAPSTTRVLTTDFSVPGVSNFAATSSNSSRYGTIEEGSKILTITSSIYIQTVGTSGGAYTQAGRIRPFDAFSRDIWKTSQQKNDDRWFITLYNDLTFPIINNDLEPYNVGFSSSIDNVLLDPLASKGVFEILGLYLPASSSPSNMIYLVMSHTFTEDRDIGGNPGLGFLMWKAEKTGKHVLVQDQMSGVGTGAFTSRFTPEEITQNLASITKEYGINKT